MRADAEIRTACASARRKLNAARKRLKEAPDLLAEIPGLFGDLDGCLESDGGRLVDQVREQVNSTLARLDQFDADLRATENGE